MRDFFKGWRRKLGCVTLVMACVFMAGWVRSIGISDWITLNAGNFQCDVRIESGVTECSVQHRIGDDVLPFEEKSRWTTDDVYTGDLESLGKINYRKSPTWFNRAYNKESE